MLSLQRKPLGHNFGNIRLFADRPAAVQPKLTIGQPGDMYEREADRVADMVMRMPGLEVQRQPEEEEEELLQAKPLLQRQVTGGAEPLPETPPIVHQVLRSPGRPLDPATRTNMESRFGHDFSRVRVHADTRAVESAKAVNARAFTLARDIVFGAGQYAPHTTEGRKLLAHELTHTIQQGVAAQGIQTKLEIMQPGDTSEGEAEATATKVAHGQTSRVTSTGIARRRVASQLDPRPMIMRKPDDTCKIIKAERNEVLGIFNVTGRAKLEDESKKAPVELFWYLPDQVDQCSEGGIAAKIVPTEEVTTFGSVAGPLFVFVLPLQVSTTPGAGQAVAVRIGSEVSRSAPPSHRQGGGASGARPAVCCAKVTTKKKKKGP